MITACIVVEPGKEPFRLDVQEKLESYQTIVGGYIQAVRLKNGLLLLCNEDGIMRQLPYNRNVEGHDIVGTFALVRTNGPDFTSVTDSDFLTWGIVAH